MSDIKSFKMSIDNKSFMNNPINLFPSKIFNQNISNIYNIYSINHYITVNVNSDTSVQIKYEIDNSTLIDINMNENNVFYLINRILQQFPSVIITDI